MYLIVGLFLILAMLLAFLSKWIRLKRDKFKENLLSNKPTPPPSVIIDLSSFKGRIIRLQKGIEYEGLFIESEESLDDALKWGEDAILYYYDEYDSNFIHSLIISIIKPDVRTKGIFQYVERSRTIVENNLYYSTSKMSRDDHAIYLEPIFSYNLGNYNLAILFSQVFAIGLSAIGIILLFAI